MSYVTPFVLFVLGVLIWRHQLSAKRRFEVAEQVLAAFHKASDGLSTLRSPMIWAAEIENAKPKKDKEGEDQADDEAPRIKSKEQQRLERRVEMHNVYVARAEAMSPAFADLRTAQILAEIHFGRPAADAMDVLFRGRQQVFAAVTGLYGSGGFDLHFANAEQAQQHREFELSMRRLLAERRAEVSTPDETDDLSQRVDAARATLESICRPLIPAASAVFESLSQVSSRPTRMRRQSPGRWYHRLPANISVPPCTVISAAEPVAPDKELLLSNLWAGIL
jgi:hypothetical protein